jgi:hypothetical protein
MKLNTEPNLADPDAFYERLIDTHNGLEFDASVALNERIVAALRALLGDPEAFDHALVLVGDSTATERDAKLVLLLANHIGDGPLLSASLASARQHLCLVSAP